MGVSQMLNRSGVPPANVGRPLVEVLAPWLRKAQNIHGITSVQTSLFQPWDVYKGSPPITFSRCLTTHQTVPYEFCKRLESPNLIQSFTAICCTYNLPFVRRKVTILSGYAQVKKNNKAGDVGVVTEELKIDVSDLMTKAKKLFSLYLESQDIPRECRLSYKTQEGRYSKSGILQTN
ncbi:hypothetical protein D910_06059 [Dendroctonus ponderosae]|uniref:Uncharacterized protein n=1 Tax=Dendroctonus ponderosae TaxID=77166 RepID=U4UFI2_DENPD|nr:hypothetical protein D910_06059 [Dendroctonus ponderosae]